MELTHPKMIHTIVEVWIETLPTNPLFANPKRIITGKGTLLLSFVRRKYVLVIMLKGSDLNQYKTLGC